MVNESTCSYLTGRRRRGAEQPSTLNSAANAAAVRAERSNRSGRRTTHSIGLLAAHASYSPLQLPFGKAPC
jgi:hypothetical protein